MIFSNRLMENYVVSTIFAIENSQNVEEIKTPLLGMGYNTTRIEEGINLHTTFSNAVQKQKAARYDQNSKTITARKAFNKAFKVYVGLVDLMRTTFENDRDIMNELGLYGHRDRTASGFIAQSTHFYNTLLNKEKIFARVTKFQITKETLAANLALVKEFEKANQVKNDGMGFVQRATSIREETYLALRHWMREFEKTCYIVLKDQSHLVEQLGFQDPADIIRKRTTPPVPPVPPDSTIPPASLSSPALTAPTQPTQRKYSRQRKPPTTPTTATPPTTAGTAQGSPAAPETDVANDQESLRN